MSTSPTRVSESVHPGIWIVREGSSDWNDPANITCLMAEHGMSILKRRFVVDLAAGLRFESSPTLAALWGMDQVWGDLDVLGNYAALSQNAPPNGIKLTFAGP